MFMMVMLLRLTGLGGLMSLHVSVVMRDDLFALMEAERGRESKSSYINHILEQYFKNKKVNE